MSCSKEKDSIFIAFSKQCGLLRQRWVLSKKSKFIPPAVRNKLRFANVFAIILWAKNLLDTWETLPAEVQKELSFLQENKPFLEEFYQIQSQSLAIQKLLKVQGYSAENHKKVKEILNKNKQKGYAKHAIFKQKTLDYLAILQQLCTLKGRLFRIRIFYFIFDLSFSNKNIQKCIL